MMTTQEIQQSPRAKPRFFYGYVVVIAALFIMLGGAGPYHTFGIFFKPLLAEFGWTRTVTSGAFSLSAIMLGLLGIAMGGLNDRFGPRMVITVCGTLLAVGYLLMSQISTVWQLYLLYGVAVGTGMAGFYVPLTSTIARWFVKRRALMTGIVASGGSIGILIGAPVANWLISVYDWRQSYMIIGGVASLFVILAGQLLRRDPTQVRQLLHDEHTGSGMRSAPVAGGYSLRDAACTKHFWLIFGVWFCLGFCTFAVVVHIVPHAIELGITTSIAANILATVGGVSIAGRVLMGSTADRVGNRRALIIAFVLMAAALFWLVSAAETWMLYLFAAVFGFAYGGCDSPVSPLVATLFGLRSHGLILGIIGIGYTVGVALGPLLAGYIFDVTDSYHIAFIGCAGIAIVGAILAAILRPPLSQKV